MCASSRSYGVGPMVWAASAIGGVRLRDKSGENVPSYLACQLCCTSFHAESRSVRTNTAAPRVHPYTINLIPAHGPLTLNLVPVDDSSHRVGKYPTTAHVAEWRGVGRQGRAGGDEGAGEEGATGQEGAHHA